MTAAAESLALLAGQDLDDPDVMAGSLLVARFFYQVTALVTPR